MRLSKLQKYILIECHNRKNFQINRKLLKSFYTKQKSKAKKELYTKIITGSIESLIDKELSLGYGVRTPHKWFIREIGLTKKGIKEARRLIGEQLKLPLKTKKKNAKNGKKT